MSDLIDRQAAIEAIKQATIHSEDESLAVEALGKLPSAQINPTQIAVNLAEYTHEEIERLKRISDNTPITLLPSAQPGIIRCKDCKYWDTTWQNDYAPNYHYCPLVDEIHRGDFYCADAERRTDG